MCDPGAVVPLPHLAQLVLAHLFERLRVERRVAFDGNLRRHASQGVNPAAMTGADHQLGVALEERLLHGDARAIGENALRVAAQLLDVAEDVVPAPAVEPGRVVAQLPQNLVRLERGEDRFDQDGRADRAAGDAERVLREGEDVVPESRLEVTLELGQVEVRPAALRDQRRRIVIERQPEVEQRCRDRRAVHVHVLLDQVPAAGSHEQRRRGGGERVALPLGTDVGDLAADGILQVLLADDVVLPGRRVGVLEIRHEDVRARVEPVDHHLAVHRARDLDPPVAQVGRDRRDGPRALAYVLRLGQEIGQAAGVELRLPRATPLEQLAPPRLEAARQRGQEIERARAQHVLAPGGRGLAELDGGNPCGHI